MSGVSGEQLYQELRDGAAKAGVSLTRFAVPLWPHPQWKLEQLRIATHPTDLTIRRVRALIAGDPLPAGRGRYIRDARAMGLSRIEAEEAGIPASGRSINEAKTLDRATALRERTEWLRHLTEVAHETRRPGQTIADRVRELKQEVA